MDNMHATAFGQAMLSTHFPHIAKLGVTMLNSGSFGIAPKSVLDSKARLVNEFESFADEFARLRQSELNSASIGCLADRLGLRPGQCALIENVTVGVSNMLHRLMAETPSDSGILVNSWTYGAVKLAAAEILSARGGGGSVAEVELRLPLASPQVVLDAVAEQLNRRPDIRVAVFDHITSTTACVMPVKQLTSLCHSRGVKVIVDGAHAIGQIKDLSIPDIGADCYIGNLNKWHFLPKSVALMWVSEALVESTKPATVSWLVHDPEFPMRYFYLGTRDTSSFYVVKDAADFIDNVCGGLDTIHSYCKSLADEGSQCLCNAWGTGLLPLPKCMEAPFMRIIKLPDHLQNQEIKEAILEVRFASKMWHYLAYRLKMDLLILNIQDTLYIRISAAVIVSMDDIRKLADAVMQMSKDDVIAD